MKTHLFAPDSQAGISRPSEENFRNFRRSPFLYTAALRFHREVLRLQLETEAVGTRVHFRRAMNTDI